MDSRALVQTAFAPRKGSICVTTVSINTPIRYHQGLWPLPAKPQSNSHGEGNDMDENIPLSGPIDLEALDDYLMSDHAPDHSMGLSDLDGFLTGIVVGPEFIPPSEWLSVIWGGSAPEFETPSRDADCARHDHGSLQ